MCLRTARCRATPNNTDRSAKAKAAELVQPLGEIEDLAEFKAPDGAAPIRGLRIDSGLLRFLLFLRLLRSHDYLSSLMCGGPSAGLVQVAGFDPSSDLRP
jgi:hypothetical protein